MFKRVMIFSQKIKITNKKYIFLSLQVANQVNQVLLQTSLKGNQ